MYKIIVVFQHQWHVYCQRLPANGARETCPLVPTRPPFAHAKVNKLVPKIIRTQTCEVDIVRLHRIQTFVIRFDYKRLLVRGGSHLCGVTPLPSQVAPRILELQEANAVHQADVEDRVRVCRDQACKYVRVLCGHTRDLMAIIAKLHQKSFNEISSQC